jgi:hypothetical protein
MVLIAGVIAIVGIAGVGKGLPALRSWEQQRIARALEMHRQLTIAARETAMLQTTRDSAAVRERRLGTLRQSMITESSVEAAAARLASIMEQIATDEGITVGTVALRPDSTIRSGMARVGVRMSAEGDVEGLAGVLFALESHGMPLVVRELTVSQSDPASPPNRPEVLRFEMYVVTLSRVRPESARAIAAGAGT